MSTVEVWGAASCGGACPAAVPLMRWPGRASAGLTLILLSLQALLWKS